MTINIVIYQTFKKVTIIRGIETWDQRPSPLQILRNLFFYLFITFICLFIFYGTLNFCTFKLLGEFLNN